MVKPNGGADGKYVCNQVLCQFGDVIPFLQNHPELSPATSGKLLHLLTDPQKSAYLRVELAAVIDCGERFVKATYNLEGDGPLVFQCYDIIAALIASIHTASPTWKLWLLLSQAHLFSIR